MTEPTYELEPFDEGDEEPRQTNPNRPPVRRGFDQSAGVPCAMCGYDLTGVPLGGACPECGAPVTHSFQAMRRAPTHSSGSAVAALVLGIISIPSCMCFGLPSMICGGIAIGLSVKARREFQQGQCSEGSQGMATAGLVTGIVGAVLGLAYVSLMAIGFISGP